MQKLILITGKPNTGKSKFASEVSDILWERHEISNHIVTLSRPIQEWLKERIWSGKKNRDGQILLQLADVYMQLAKDDGHYWMKKAVERFRDEVSVNIGVGLWHYKHLPYFERKFDLELVKVKRYTDSSFDVEYEHERHEVDVNPYYVPDGVVDYIKKASDEVQLRACAESYVSESSLVSSIKS